MMMRVAVWAVLLVPCFVFSADQTVICFGDSITQGTNPAALKQEQRWVEILQQRAGAGVKVVNEGKGGRPASALKEFREMLGRYPSIEVLIIALGTNDSRNTAADAGEQYAKNLAVMVEEARKKNATMQIVLCAPYNLRPDALKKNAELGPVRVKNLEGFGVSAKALSEKEKTAFVNLYGVLPNESLTTDGVHPGATGHAAIADALWPVLKTILKK